MLAVSVVDDVLESVNSDLFILLIDPGIRAGADRNVVSGFLETLKTPEQRCQRAHHLAIRRQ